MKETFMLRAKVSLFVAVTALVASVGVGVGTAVAQGNRPHTEPVTGEFNGTPVNVMRRTCPGEDGVYLELRGRWAGTITSSDPRLTGNLEFMANPALVNVVTGLGTFRGTFSVTDPVTNQQKGRGEFHTVVTEGSLNHGFALGKVMNQDGGPADDFFGNLKSTIDPLTLVVVGELGATDADPRTPAVIQGGHCSGPFTRVP
jgi:hypothetical protein